MEKYVHIEINNFGTVIFKMRYDLSPVNCAKFEQFVREGLFDHRIIQRIAPDFVLQFTYENYQDPRMECMTDLERSIEPFKKGTVALGGDGQYISSPADFFITITDEHTRKLNFNYSIIGEVVQGYDIVEKIIAVPTKRITMKDAPSVVVMQPLEDIIVYKMYISEE